MAIGNEARGLRRVRLRLRADGGWYYLSRAQLGWVGPYDVAVQAFSAARAVGDLWRNEEFYR